MRNGERWSYLGVRRRDRRIDPCIGWLRLWVELIRVSIPHSFGGSHDFDQSSNRAALDERTFKEKEVALFYATDDGLEIDEDILLCISSYDFPVVGGILPDLH